MFYVYLTVGLVILLYCAIIAFLIWLGIYRKRRIKTLQGCNVSYLEGENPSYIYILMDMYNHGFWLHKPLKEDILRLLILGCAEFGFSDIAEKYTEKIKKSNFPLYNEMKMGYLISAHEFEKCYELADELSKTSNNKETLTISNYFKAIITENCYRKSGYEYYMQAYKYSKTKIDKLTFYRLAMTSALYRNETQLVKQAAEDKNNKLSKQYKFIYKAMLDEFEKAKQNGIEVETLTKQIENDIIKTRRVCKNYLPYYKENENDTPTHVGGKSYLNNIPENYFNFIEINLRDFGKQGLVQVFITNDVLDNSNLLVENEKYKIIYTKDFEKQDSNNENEIPERCYRAVDSVCTVSYCDQTFKQKIYDKYGVTVEGTNNYIPYGYLTRNECNNALSYPNFYETNYDIDTAKYNLNLFSIKYKDYLYSLFMNQTSYDNDDFNDIVLYKEKIPMGPNLNDELNNMK